MGRRAAGLLVMGLLAAALTAGPVVAQADPAQPTQIRFEPSEFMFIFPDPCNPGEEVTITGTATGFITEVVTPTGDIIRKLHLQQKGTGVGSEGSEYSLQLILNERLTVAETDPEGNPTLYTASGPFVMNNLGSGPNFVTQAVVHVRYVNGEPVVEFFRENKAECLG